MKVEGITLYFALKRNECGGRKKVGITKARGDIKIVPDFFLQIHATIKFA